MITQFYWFPYTFFTCLNVQKKYIIYQFKVNINFEMVVKE